MTGKKSERVGATVIHCEKCNFIHEPFDGCKLKNLIDNWPTVQRGNCQDCGNPWWFDKGNMGWVCTTCYKTHGKG